MKNIEIKGKHQLDKINKATNPNTDIVAERDCMTPLPDYVFDNRFQIQMINKLYLDSDFEYKKELLREIDKKILSYKNQDINKKKYENNNISQTQTIEKIVASKLKCYYCKCNMKLFYKKVRDINQWTLDRINNDLPHQNDNVITCCLKCNLQRRKQNKDKFLFTKQLKIVKNSYN